jgi:hypothetical protein
VTAQAPLPIITATVTHQIELLQLEANLLALFRIGAYTRMGKSGTSYNESLHAEFSRLIPKSISKATYEMCQLIVSILIMKHNDRY